MPNVMVSTPLVVHRALPWCASAMARFASSERSQSSISSSPPSSIFAKKTRRSVSYAMRATCLWMPLVHSLSPSVISMTSVLAFMTESGVLGSWLSSVTNRRCLA